MILLLNRSMSQPSEINVKLNLGQNNHGEQCGKFCVTMQENGEI